MVDFFMVDVGGHKAVRMGQDKILQGEVMARHRGADQGVAQVQCGQGIGFS